MNFKTTLVLLVLLAMVGGYFLMFGPGEGRPGADDAPDAAGIALPAVADLEPAGIDRIDITRGNVHATLARQRDDWAQVAPVHFPIEAEAAQRIAAAVARLRYHREFQPGAANMPGLDDIGLTQPRATVRVGSASDAGTVAGGPGVTVHLGRRQVDGRAYVRVGDDEATAYIVDDTLHRLVLDASVRDWRRRELSAPSRDRAERIELARAGASVTLHRTDGRWYIGDGQRQRANREAIDAMLAPVRPMRIATFAADGPEELRGYGLDEPRATLAVHEPTPNGPGDADGTAEPTTRQTVLRIGANADIDGETIFATWDSGEASPPVVFTVERSLLDALAVDVDALRDPRVVLTRRDELEAMRVTREEGQPIEIVRSGGRGYAFGDPEPGFALDYDLAVRVIDSVTEARATAYIAAYEPTGSPAAVVTLTRRGSDEPEAVMLHIEEDGLVALRRGENVGYRVEGQTLAGLFEPVIALRDRELLNLSGAKLRGVTLRRDDGATFRLSRDSAAGEAGAERGTWRLGEEEPYDEEAVDRLLGALAPLRVERWLEDEPTIDEATAIELTLERESGSPHILRVDAQTREGELVGDASVPGFVLGEAALDRLAGELRPGTLLAVARDAIREVRIERGGEAVTVRRTNGRYRADVEATVDAVAAGALWDTLAGLRVARWVEIDAARAGEPVQRVTVDAGGAGPHVLTLHEIDGRVVGRMGERWFELGAAALGRVRGELLEREEAQVQPGVPGMSGVGEPMK